MYVLLPPSLVASFACAAIAITIYFVSLLPGKNAGPSPLARTRSSATTPQAAYDGGVELETGLRGAPADSDPELPKYTTPRRKESLPPRYGGDNSLGSNSITTREV
jgi:hypothetical protein